MAGLEEHPMAKGEDNRESLGDMVPFEGTIEWVKLLSGANTR